MNGPMLPAAGAAGTRLDHARRSHSNPKVIADRQGHGLGVHLSDYVDSPLARKRDTLADFKALLPGN